MSHLPRLGHYVCVVILVMPLLCVQCYAPVYGASTLELVVESDFSGHARAVWVDPHLLCAPVPDALTDLHEAASQLQVSDVSNLFCQEVPCWFGAGPGSSATPFDTHSIIQCARQFATECRLTTSERKLDLDTMQSNLCGQSVSGKTSLNARHRALEF